MAKITWKGEAEGPPSCTWNGVTFPVGRAVEVADPWMIAKAHGNAFFKVDNESSKERPVATQWREPETEVDPADQPPPLDFPPDYPPEEEPKRKPGRPRNKVKDNGV